MDFNQKLKKKIDSSLPDQQGAGNNQTSADNVFNFDEQDSPQPPTGGQSLGSENKIPRLSVQIVQKINNQQQEHSQTIQTNVTVSSTLKHYSEDSPQPGNNTTNTSIHTSVECKQEPVEEPQCRLYQQNQNNQQPQQQTSQAPGSNKSASSDIGFDDHNLDELSDILNNLDKVGGELPPDILKELDKFHEICVKVQQHSEGNDSRNMYSPLSSTSPGLGKGSFPDNMPPRGPINPVFEGNQNVNNVSNPLTTIHGPQSAPIADSAGPAASTLKQMAAQHQQNTPYGMKASAIDPFADPLSENFSRRQEYPAYSQHQNFGNMPQGQNSFPYNQNQSFQHMQTKPDIAAMNYGGTKPLTHFSDHNNQGSQPPLQQLQNQVRSQFNQSPNPQMQITQTQQMQVSHGQQRLHLSQTQQLQMQQAPQQISMSQQQSFSMQGHMNQPNMMNDQMNMQMMEKMRQDQTRQQQQQQQQRQQQMQQERQQQMRQRQGQMMDPQQQSQMPSQYMNRPPPEYKMQPGAQSATFNQNGGSLNPLQTMQNMVDQTGGYGIVKSEVPTPQPQNGASIMQMSAMQQSMSAAVSGNTQTAQATRAGYMVQHIQRPPSYPGQGQPPTRPQQQPPSTYTSAILRNQRPPNVNVGPDGLNISQPRNQGHEWPRPMMPGGQRPPMQTQTSMTQQSAAMMQQYNQYPTSTQSMAPGVMHMQRPEMNAMQNQNALMPNGSATVMMQQQSMQMTQHGVMRPHQPGSYNMANSSQMPNANSAQGGYPSSSTQDDFMNFLDNAQNSNSDIFDSLGHNSGTTDFNLLDEILVYNLSEVLPNICGAKEKGPFIIFMEDL
ncbi:hypothetical protein LOTGIDRAFT_171182 [Lottia gigantea]|uniref:Neurogenic mastermind-like N-terminal domain-containing protein n=1 Tax=Lottia gigantea TaxID=225164 RepID=V4B0K4_LOTGI|nr:hypothetical protein LOTGIDRAFT_171182 [Lottia gigantea]ESP03653.1 hypothetical protein LOTGIDRAFT_171182 [Lottia gigantea]